MNTPAIRLKRFFMGIWSMPVGREAIRYGGISFLVVVLFIGLPAFLNPHGHEALLVGLAGVITITALFTGIVPAVLVIILAGFLAYTAEEPVGTAERIYALQEVGMLTVFGALMIGIKAFHQRQNRTTSHEAKQFRTLLEHSLYPLLLKNTQGGITFVSSTAADLLDYKEHELFGRTLHEFVHKDDRQALQTIFAEIFRRPKKRMRGEFRVQKKDGSWLWLRTDALNLLNEEPVNSVVVNIQDITQQKQIDKERLESLERETQARALAEQAVRARDEFLSIASHELKTPLTTVLLQLQATLRRTSTQSLAHFSGEKLVQSLTIAEQQSKRLSELIKDLLNVSLITTGRISLKKEPVNLSGCIRSLIERLGEQIKEAGTPIIFEETQEIIGVWDVVRLEQCLTNLLTNAMKYGGHKPITISTRRDPQWIYIDVIDSGRGIPSQDQSRIFELFQRVIAADDIKGLGVGLFIARRIAEAHGGTITVESEHGKGSTFTVQLPLSPLPTA